jgi:uncharacterized membrane-anchored protein
MRRYTAVAYWLAVVMVGVFGTMAAGYRWGGWNPVLSFWMAYVLTRPLGASVADWLGKPKSFSGLGLGNGPVSVCC